MGENTICISCEHLVVAKLHEDIDTEEYACLCGIKAIEVVKCSHFEVKNETNM